MDRIVSSESNLEDDLGWKLVETIFNPYSSSHTVDSAPQQ